MKRPENPRFSGLFLYRRVTAARSGESDTFLIALRFWVLLLGGAETRKTHFPLLQNGVFGSASPDGLLRQSAHRFSKANCALCDAEASSCESAPFTLPLSAGDDLIMGLE